VLSESSLGPLFFGGLSGLYESASSPKLDGVNVSDPLRNLTRLIFTGTEKINAIDYVAEASNDVGSIFLH
jgi:hypothetical protein